MVAVPLVRIGGGWGELKGKKNAQKTLRGDAQILEGVGLNLENFQRAPRKNS